MLYSFSSRSTSLSTSPSPLSRRGINRLYSRIGLWTIIVVCVWLYIQGSSTPRRRKELVTGRTKAERRFGAGSLKESHEEHLDAFLRRVKIKPEVTVPLAVSPPPPPPRVLSSTENQPKGVGEGGVPIFKTTKASQRMALFVLWPKKGGVLDQSSFLLQSFLASPSSHVVDLVLLVRGTDSECVSHRRWISDQERKIEEVGKHTSVARTVCLTEAKYLEMHRDYLCEKWECSIEEEKRMLDHLLENSKVGDVFEDRFRFLRGLVFDRFVDKKIKWFGWAGHEVVLGNVYRQFPWDIAPNFDVVVPAVVSVSKDTSLALSPHLGFFQHRPSTEARLLDLPGLRSVEDFLSPPRKQTFNDLSTSLLSSPKTTFLAFEAHLSPIAVPPTIARVVTQNSVFTLFLPLATSSKSSIPLLTQSHRKRFIFLINALRTPVHLRGTFSPTGVTSSVAAGGLGSFERLAPSSGGLWNGKESIFRLKSGGGIFKREEPRAWEEEHEEMILEWAFDLAPNHKTTPFYPPPYPPRRLEQSHALAFLPSGTSTPPNSNQPFGFKEEIWDPKTPAIKEAAHDGEWWDGQHWIPQAQPKKKMVGVVKRDTVALSESEASS